MAKPNFITNFINNADVVGSDVLKGTKAIKAISKLAKRKSIMTMAEPGMYQYPLLTSTGIDNDIIASIAKAYQLNYASSVVVAYSLNPIMYLKETPELTDFVKKFHTNSTTPGNFNIDAAANTLGIESLMSIDESGEIDVAVENSIINDDFTREELIAMGSTNIVEDGLCMESLNDAYRPYDRVHRILSEKLDDMKVAAEDSADVDATMVAINNAAAVRASNIVRKSNVNKLDDIAQNVNSFGVYSTQIAPKPRITGRTFNNAIVRNNQLEALEPTMVNVQIMCHGKVDGNGTQFLQNLTLGVKTVPRVISSDLMIASMIEACKDGHFIFKFLKWTSNEVKTLDFILGISASKKKALEKSAKQEVKLLNQAKKRKKSNFFGKFLKNEVLPTLTIVITSYEAAKIKEACGCDLNDLKEAVRLMNKYYLLSFGIYDTEQNTLKVLFDCDSEWSYTSISNLKNGVSKVNDTLNQNLIGQMFGRR